MYLCNYFGTIGLLKIVYVHKFCELQSHALANVPKSADEMRLCTVFVCRIVHLQFSVRNRLFTSSKYAISNDI